jgi:DNA-binding response OmpR family regulator
MIKLEGCERMRLLVVEDDRLLNNTLCYNLSVSGYAVDSAMTMAEAVRFFETQDYDLIVLDVNLPDGNGFDFCKQIKERRPDTAVIFLTANDMESDMLKGFELGADDYVTKPFPISVFRKKVSVLLGRIQKQTGGDRYTNGTLSINFSELTAELSGSPITFTPLEYRLLKVLVRNPKIVLTRQVLLEKLWDVDENFVDEHTLTVTISRIRSKIEVDGLQYIKTVYGMGYMWIGGLKK